MSASRSTRPAKRRRFCYWTVANDEYADLAKGMIASARRCGVAEDFHVWTDRNEIPGAIVHRAGSFDNWGWLFKLVFLKEEASQLDYDYVIYLDADTCFVRHPGDVLRVVRDSPFHITLDADLTDRCRQGSWWEYPRATFIDLARGAGVKSSSIYNVNGGMFIAQRDAIPVIYHLADKFWRTCRQEGVWYVDEPLLAYAMQMLCDNPQAHTLEQTHDLWATDWNGVFAHRLPDNRPFRFTGFFRMRTLRVNPAIVHAIRSKQVLLADAGVRRTSIREANVQNARNRTIDNKAQPRRRTGKRASAHKTSSGT